MLTLIPEQERSIDYRFEFAIVGEGAKIFAEAAVNSEMAEAFRPTAKHKAEEEDKNHAHEDEHGRGHERKSPDVTEYVLFCPIGEGTKALARVRFTCIEQFSDSLPLGRDGVAAQSQAVIFLYHPNAVADRSSDNSPVDDFKHEFISRWAEINHTPQQFRPHARILAFEAEPGVEEALAEIGKSKHVTLDAQTEHCEDIVMEALQSVCEHLITRVNERRTSVAQNDASTVPLIPQKSSCCSLL